MTMMMQEFTDADLVEQKVEVCTVLFTVQGITMMVMTW